MVQDDFFQKCYKTNYKVMAVLRTITNRLIINCITGKNKKTKKRVQDNTKLQGTYACSISLLSKMDMGTFT